MKSSRLLIWIRMLCAPYLTNELYPFTYIFVVAMHSNASRETKSRLCLDCEDPLILNLTRKWKVIKFSFFKEMTFLLPPTFYFISIVTTCKTRRGKKIRFKLNKEKEWKSYKDGCPMLNCWSALTRLIFIGVSIKHS